MDLVPAFVTFGMFIIDEIEFTDSKAPQQDLIGGAGVYAALGARLVAGSRHADSISWIVDMGSDFPVSLKALIEQWNTSCLFRLDETRLTTKAWNGYGANEHRSFKYLTPKRRIEVESLTDVQAQASSFHMVCSSTRSLHLSTTLKDRRQQLGINGTAPIIIWEPIPDLCTPEELDKLQSAAAHVNVVSPNAEELMDFFPAFAVSTQDEMVPQLVGWKLGRCLSTFVVIREGAEGSSIYLPPTHEEEAGISSDQQSLKLHLNAFHDKSMADRVVDPTGGGNTYLGGLAIGMTTRLDGSSVFNTIAAALPGLELDQQPPSSNSRIIVGALCAVIAASYAIEQLGTPKLTAHALSAQMTQEERWNEESFTQRLEYYVERERAHIETQLAKLQHLL